MKKYLHFLNIILFLNLLSVTNAYGQCDGCQVMICDGITCDDGSSADGVQTSRNCGCGKEISGACATVTINLTSNPYYDPADPDCGLLMTTQESGNFSIYFLESGCTVTNCQSPDAVASNNQVISNLPGSPSFELMVCKNGGNAGRRDFNFSISCSTIENCVNSIDDDNNGFVDCDDPACSLNDKCDYSTASSSNDGGLESNNRLSQKIADQKFQKTKKSFDAKSLINDETLILGPNRKQSIETRTEIQIGDLIPANALEEVMLYNTTPFELVDITNAEEVYGVDMIMGADRVASMLVTRTNEEVYEHTKYICDRLGGASIENIWSYKFDGQHSMIVAKFKDEKGNVEYNTNFSLIKSDGSVSIESHWNLAEYPKGEELYNFQIWANNTLYLEKIVNNTLSILNDRFRVDTYKSNDLPDLYIKSIEYKGGKVTMKIRNQGHYTRAFLKGIHRQTETEADQEFSRYIQMKGDEEEEVVMEVAGIYDLSFFIHSGKSFTPDVVYLSDGVWGTNYAQDGMLVDEFLIKPFLSKNNDPDNYLIERDVSVEGQLKSGFSVYRSLHPNFKSVDLSSYNSFNFTGVGRGDTEIVLIHEDIKHWEDQIRTSVRLNEEPTHFSLSKEDFTRYDLEWDKIRMIVFNFQGNQVEYAPFKVEISNTLFEYRENIEPFIIEEKKLDISPNPFTDHTNVSFFSEEFGTYRLQLFSIDGNCLMDMDGRTVKGTNMVGIRNHNYPAGLYTVRVIVQNKEILTSKISIVK